MNNIFQIDRFLKLANRRWLHPTNFSWRNILTIAALPLFFLLINILSGNPVMSIDGRESTLSFLIIVSLVFSPFMYFYNYNHPKKGITDVLIPASVFEKYLIMQLTCIVFSPLFVLVIYGGVDSFLSLLFSKQFNGYAVTQFFREMDLNWEKIMTIFTFQQFILFSNLWFRRNKLFKTFGFIMLFHIALTIIAIGLFYLFTKDLQDMSSFQLNVYTGRGNSLLFSIHDQPTVIVVQLLRIFVDIILPVGLVIGSYCVMKTNKY